MAAGEGDGGAAKVCAVTGGARGIGFAIAERMGTAEGCKIALLDVNEEALGEAVGKLEAKGVTALAVKLDVTSEEGWATATAAIEKEFGGGVDILVQSAGITGKTGVKTAEVETANFDLVYRINVLGIFLGMKSVLPGMVAKGWGRVVNIASIAGKEGNAGMCPYSCSKAAVIGMTKATGKEYAETGVTVNAIAPAVVRTEMVAAMPAEQVKYMTDKIPMKRTGELNEIAALAQFIASKEASFTTAFTFDATGGRAVY